MYHKSNDQLACFVFKCTALLRFLVVLMHALMYAYRGRCTFDEKFTIAKSAKAAGVIIINNELSVFAMPSSGLHAARVVAAPDAAQGSIYRDSVSFDVVFASQLPYCGSIPD